MTELAKEFSPQGVRFFLVDSNADDTAVKLKAYAAERPFTDDERKVWPLMLQTAAMRFWLSRLEQINPDGSYMKNPDDFRDILRARVERPDQLPV